jgi:hypothetical protein
MTRAVPVESSNSDPGLKTSSAPSECALESEDDTISEKSHIVPTQADQPLAESGVVEDLFEAYEDDLRLALKGHVEMFPRIVNTITNILKKDVHSEYGMQMTVLRAQRLVQILMKESFDAGGEEAVDCDEGVLCRPRLPSSACVLVALSSLYLPPIPKGIAHALLVDDYWKTTCAFLVLMDMTPSYLCSLVTTCLLFREENTVSFVKGKLESLVVPFVQRFFRVKGQKRK